MLWAMWEYLLHPRMHQEQHFLEKGQLLPSSTENRALETWLFQSACDAGWFNFVSLSLLVCLMGTRMGVENKEQDNAYDAPGASRLWLWTRAWGSLASGCHTRPHHGASWLPRYRPFSSLHFQRPQFCETLEGLQVPRCVAVCSHQLKVMCLDR